MIQDPTQDPAASAKLGSLGGSQGMDRSAGIGLGCWEAGNSHDAEAGCQRERNRRTVTVVDAYGR